MSNLKTTALVSTGLLVGMLAAVTAGAQEPATDQSDAPKLIVQYRTAQLETDQGVRHLYSRLARAAEAVCPQSSTRLVSDAVLACRQQAMTEAVAHIHNARLAALTNRTTKSG